LRIATRERIATIQARTKVQVRLRAHLRQMGASLPTVKITAQRGWAFLQKLVEDTPGTRGMALESLLLQFEHLDEAVGDWDAEIERLAEQFPAVGTLEKEAPGVGTALAATIAAEAWPLQRFRTPKAFARYTGLTPSDRSTGGRQIHGAITREGSSYLRWALTQAAMACLRAKRGPSVAAGDWIRAKQKRMGCKSKARTAGARKLAEQIWRLFHFGECFDPQRPFGAAA
jgi:transposase